MSLRIRTDGTVLCGALHPAEPGDVYLDDEAQYRIGVVCRALQADSAGVWHFVAQGSRDFAADSPDHGVVP